MASHRSAAAAHGWELKVLPPRPCITVDLDRTIAADRRGTVELHWSRLEATDVQDGWVTSRERTLVDCSRHLPLDEALAVTDSALRHRHVTADRLRDLAASLRGPGSAQARRVAREATGAAANPFESTLRAIALDVPGLRLKPQVLVVAEPFSIRPDLSDEALQLALEADSFAWHGSRDALKPDCRRYNLLVLAGWRVLRFSWEDVMLAPAQVRETLGAAVAVVHRPEELPPQRPTHA